MLDIPDMARSTVSNLVGRLGEAIQERSSSAGGTFAQRATTGVRWRTVTSHM
jgi:hypothetical protein